MGDNKVFINQDIVVAGSRDVFQVTSSWPLQNPLFQAWPGSSNMGFTMFLQ